MHTVFHVAPFNPDLSPQVLRPPPQQQTGQVNAGYRAVNHTQTGTEKPDSIGIPRGAHGDRGATPDGGIAKRNHPWDIAVKDSLITKYSEYGRSSRLNRQH